MKTNSNRLTGKVARVTGGSSDVSNLADLDLLDAAIKEQKGRRLPDLAGSRMECLESGRG